MAQSLRENNALMKMLDGIAEVTSAFFAAFTNISGPAPVDSLYDICLPETVVVNATGATPAVYTLRQFVEPRRTLLESGALTEFREYEVSGDTILCGRIAHRTSRYEKTWTERGQRMHGAGTKIFSFVSTPLGWKIASVLWHDDDAPRQEPLEVQE